METGRPLMTAEELSEYLRLSKQAIYNLVLRREIPFIKLGRRLRFDPEAIESWLEGQRVSPT